MQPSVTHIGFYLQIHDRLLLTVIYSGDACQVTLSLIGLDTVYDVNRKILGSHGTVISKILLTVNQYPGHGTAVYGYASVLIHLYAGQSLDKFLQDRTFRHTESTHVEHQGIINHLSRRKRILNNRLGKKDTAFIHLEYA